MPILAPPTDQDPTNPRNQHDQPGRPKAAVINAFMQAGLRECAWHSQHLETDLSTSARHEPPRA
jgi:hypothetical protein